MRLTINFALFCLLFFLASAQDNRPEISREDLEFMKAASENNLFLESSPDLIDEPQSINRFFTQDIYARLAGNEFFGYFFDEGFSWSGDSVSIDIIKTILSTQIYHHAFHESFKSAMLDRGLDSVSQSPFRVGLCLVGVEPVRTPETVPGVMIEVYFSNRSSGESFFWRVGVGSRNGLAASMVDAADLIVEMLLEKRK